MTIIKTAQLPKLTSGSGPGPVFHKILTPLRIRVRMKNRDSCRNRLRHTGIVATSAFGVLETFESVDLILPLLASIDYLSPSNLYTHARGKFFWRRFATL